LAPERSADRFGRSAGHGAGARINVVGPNDRAGDLAHEIVLFVRGQRRGEEADRSRPVLLPHLRQARRGELERFVPRRRLLAAVSANQRCLEALDVLDRVIVEAAADAELIAADRIGCRVRPYDDAAPAFRAERNRAADGALCASGRDPAFGLGGAPFVRVLHERSGGTNVDAGAAEITVRFVDCTALAELDARAVP